MKRIWVVFIALAFIVPLKAQSGILIDTLRIDLSEYIGDTINQMFPINQIGTIWSVTLKFEGFDAVDSKVGIKGTGYQSMFYAPFMSSTMPVTVSDTTNHLSFWGTTQPYPYQGVWVDKQSVTTGIIRAKRIMYCPFLMFTPWEL